MINFDQLNTIILLGDQIKTINPVMAYYIKYHAIKRVLAYVNSNFRIPNFKQIDLQITKIRQEIEQLKKQNQQRFLNFDDDMKMIEDSTLKLFNHLDDKERQGSCDLASSFIFCAHMMALLFYYLPKRLDFKEKKMYSQFKALDQYQKLECSGVIINNIKVHIGMFVDSYLFDPQPQIQQQYQPQQQKQHFEPPTIKAVKVQPTESMMAFQELQKKTKDHIQAAISELDFKNIPNSISKPLQEEQKSDSTQQNNSQQATQAGKSEDTAIKPQNDTSNKQLELNDNMQQPKSQETAINENNQNTDLNQETKQSIQEEQNNDHGDSQDQQMVQSKVSQSKINDSKIQQQNNEKTDQNDLQVSKGIEFQEEQNQNNQSNIQVKQELEQIDNSSLSFGKAPQTSQENKQQNSDNSNQNEQILASIKKQQSQSSKISTTKQLNQKSNVIEQNSEGQEQINDHGQQQSSKISKITKSNVKEEHPESQEDNNSSQQIQEDINKNKDGADNVDKNQQIKEQQISDVKEEQIIDQGSKLANEEQENNQIEQIEQSEQNELNKDTILKELTSEERSKLRERFLMDLAIPKIKKHKNENDKDYQSFTELPIDIARLPRKKSAIQHQILSKSPPKKQNTQIKRRIIQDLKDFKENNYKVLTEEQKIQKRQQLEEQEQMQQNDKQIIETPQLDEKQRKIESLKKDLKRFEQTKEIREVKKETQLNQSEVKVNKNQSKGGKKKNKKSPSKSEKKQMSKSPEIKVVYTEVKRKIEIKNDIRSRIQINKDEGKNKEAIEFVRKMQRLRHESESKKNKELENIGQKIQQGIDKYKTSNQIAKLMIIKEKRKKALESITNQEKKRLDIMSKQQMNLKFVQELKKKADYLGHYSVKKLSYPMQMITELDNGQIQLQDMIDTNRKLNEKQFLSIEEQKQQKLELVKKQQDYGKQVSLLHFPKVNLQKQDYHETIDEQPVIKKKQKKAWQIEQELQQKQNLDSSQLK